MRKKGFTLVELLAVIAILAILVIIALPNVMGMFNTAKKSAFTTELKEVYKVAQQQWMNDSLFNTGEKVYSRCSGCTGTSLELTGRDNLDYYIVIDKSGSISKFYATDGTYQFSYEGDLLATYINDVETIAEIDDDDIIEITDSGATSKKAAKLICKRATVLHTETCANGKRGSADITSSSNTYCKGDGLGNTITYGSLGTKGTLTPGDAFDCDVNGDGRFDSSNERFYYVSPKDADTTSDYITLIYYSNTVNGVPSNSGTFAYGSISYSGPNVLYLQLPTTSQWPKVRLSETVRQIKTNTNTTRVYHDGSYYNLSTFDYGNRAARLITYQEAVYACGSGQTNKFGYLRNCNYLLENTVYTSADNVNGYHLETWTDSAQYVYNTQTVWRILSANSYIFDAHNGARPVIEINKENIEI